MSARWMPALALALLLAGCASPPAESDAPAAAPATHVETRAWALEQPMLRDGGCVTPPGFCFGGRGGGWPTFRLAANERILAFDLGIAFNGTGPADSGDPVNAKARCREEAEPCEANATVEARMPLPLHMSAEGLDWPWGAGLELEFERDPDMAKYGESLFLSPDVRIEATITVEVDDAAPPPVLAEVRTPFAYDTVTGACGMLVEPDCESGPWRTLYLGGVRGSATRVWANATWDAVSPTAQTLRFTFYCYVERWPCEGAGFPLVFEGTSPLAMDSGDLAALRVPGEAQFQVSVVESGAEPYPGFTALTRQPFRFEGEFLSLDAVAEE